MDTDKLIPEKAKSEEIKLTRVQKLLKNRKLIVEPIACILFFAVFLSGKYLPTKKLYFSYNESLPDYSSSDH